jgi:nitrite reductase (NO-forming)
MAAPNQADTDQDTSTMPDGGSPPGMPRWVKVGGIAVGILILLGVLVMMIGGVEHGPGLHGPGGGAGADHQEDAAPIEGAPQLAVTAADLRFDTDSISLPAGIPVNVALTSTDILHDLVVDEIGFHLAADRGETAVGGLVFTEPGTYVGYCSVPGHREAGMELEIVVGDHEDLEEFFRELHG